MSTTKINGMPRAVPAPVRKSTGYKIFIQLVALTLQLPPAAYIAITGTVPLWARIWLWVWLSMWLLATVVQAVRAQGGNR